MRSWLVLFLLASCGRDSVPGDDPATVDALMRGDDTTDALVVDSDLTSPDAGAPDSPALTACEDAASHSDLAWIEQHVFAPSCATTGCHTGTNPSVHLRLDPGFARENLVNASSSTQGGWVRVVPGSPSSSYLLVAVGRVSGPPPRDGIMPLGAPALCAPMIDAIERWIAAGAQ
jgi:hypothetical protein